MIAAVAFPTEFHAVTTAASLAFHVAETTSATALTALILTLKSAKTPTLNVSQRPHSLLKKFTLAALARTPSTIAANMPIRSEHSPSTEQSGLLNPFNSLNAHALRKLHAERAKKRSATRPMLTNARTKKIATNSAYAQLTLRSSTIVAVENTSYTKRPPPMSLLSEKENIL